VENQQMSKLANPQIASAEKMKLFLTIKHFGLFSRTAYQ
jgi:hypothetical protein